MPKLRVIDDTGKNLGVISLAEALGIAQGKNLDLVEVQPNANPPVAKIVSWAKLLYREQKAERKKHLSKGGKVKGVRFTLVTHQHDLGIKAKRAREFFDKGYKVKVQIRLRRFERELKDRIKGKIKEFLLLVAVPVAFDQKPEKSPFGYTFIIRKDTNAQNIKDNKKEVQDNQDRQGAVSAGGN